MITLGPSLTGLRGTQPTVSIIYTLVTVLVAVQCDLLQPSACPRYVVVEHGVLSSCIHNLDLYHA
jgi:hypothetical protein